MNQNREQLISQLKEPLDILIIGGGITGAGVLREATRLGYNAALVEQQDYAWGTSSRSSKLVHGGLRYLKQGHVMLTYHSLSEREWLIKSLPGLVEPLNFYLPIYKGHGPNRLLLKIGLMAYDLLAKCWSHKYFGKKKFSQKVKKIAQDKLLGAFEYPDAITDDCRLTLRVLQEATAAGGLALNYMKATHFKKTDDMWQIDLLDKTAEQTLTAQAKVVINASGVWSHELCQTVETDHDYPKLRPLRGSHIQIPQWRFPIKQAFTLTHPCDGRVAFVYPWEGITMIGTTDLDHTDNLSFEPKMTETELNYLLDLFNYYFPDVDLKRADVLSSMAGVRPVIDTGKANPSDESRDSKLIDDDGLLTLMGGKLTTFRLMAQDIMKLAKKHLAKPTQDDDYFKPLAPNGEKLNAIEKKIRARFGDDVLAQIKNSAGTQDLQAIEATGTTLAELKWSLANEQVVHLDDLLLRRSRLGLLLPGGGYVLFPILKHHCQTMLGWSDEQWQQEVARYTKIWKECYYLPEGEQSNP